MPVVVCLCAVLFANLYLRSVESGIVKEGLLLGLILFSVSVAIDILALSRLDAGEKHFGQESRRQILWYNYHNAEYP